MALKLMSIAEAIPVPLAAMAEAAWSIAIAVVANVSIIRVSTVTTKSRMAQNLTLTVGAVVLKNVLLDKAAQTIASARATTATRH